MTCENKNDFRFGPNKHFTGTNDEWIELKRTIAFWNEESSSYPYVTVKCPHCGVKNTHNISKDIIPSHHECDMMIDKFGNTIFYDCPGYIISRHIN